MISRSRVSILKTLSLLQLLRMIVKARDVKRFIGPISRTLRFKRLLVTDSNRASSMEFSAGFARTITNSWICLWRAKKFSSRRTSMQSNLTFFKAGATRPVIPPELIVMSSSLFKSREIDWSIPSGAVASFSQVSSDWLWQRNGFDNILTAHGFRITHPSPTILANWVSPH